jgi:hypothetical protein
MTGIGKFLVWIFKFGISVVPVQTFGKEKVHNTECYEPPVEKGIQTLAI